MTNFVKNHESGVKSQNHTNQVNAILDNIENTPFALRGATVKTILYFLFSVIAAVELSAALYFYACSLGVPQSVTLIVCGVVAFGFHFLLHSILTDTAKGIVFGKRGESGAMANEVTANIILSIILLLMAACSVFFIGKKGFTAYRATQYEVKDKAEIKTPGLNINDIQLKDKNGKIAAWKLETLTDYKKAESKATDSETAKQESNRARYDTTTTTITDIVGASAFVLEILLALLAYTIATAKKAAVIDEMARRKNNQIDNVFQDMGTVQTLSNQAQTVINTTPPPSENKRQIGFINLSDNEQLNEVQRIHSMFPSTTVSTIYSVLEHHNFIVPVSLGELINLFGTSTTANVTTHHQAQNNEERTIIKGFHTGTTDAVKRQTFTDAVNKLKICQHCKAEYMYKIHNQKFCSESCRIAAWEQKTGIRFRKKNLD